jgi:2-isopropylmalate synthase
MRPEDVGFVGTNLVLGKHSGRHAFRTRLAELGYELADEPFQKVFEDFIVLADKKKHVYDADIVAIVEQRGSATNERWTLKRFHISAGTNTIATATVELLHSDGRTLCDAAIGDGPVDAVFKTLERLTGLEAKLEEYQVRSISEGQDAQGEVLVDVVVNGATYHGKGISTDIVEASAAAYLKALNKAANASQAGESLRGV